MNTTTKILMALGLAAISTCGWATTIPEIPADGQRSGSGTGTGTGTGTEPGAETWDENGHTQPYRNPGAQPAGTGLGTTHEGTEPAISDDKGTTGMDKNRANRKGNPDSGLRDAPSDPIAPADRMLTDKVNKGFKADKKLATGIKNVKVSSLNGHVTLNGHVATEAEKASIEAAASAIEGVEMVMNNLKIKTGKKKMIKEEPKRATPTDWHRAK